MLVMQKYITSHVETDDINGEPDTGRLVSPVRRRVLGNLPQKCGKAPGA